MKFIGTFLPRQFYNISRIFFEVAVLVLCLVRCRFHFFLNFLFSSSVLLLSPLIRYGSAVVAAQLSTFIAPQLLRLIVAHFPWVVSDSVKSPNVYFSNVFVQSEYVLHFMYLSRVWKSCCCCCFFFLYFDVEFMLCDAVCSPWSDFITLYGICFRLAARWRSARRYKFWDFHSHRSDWNFLNLPHGKNRTHFSASQIRCWICS